jgi:hypothetical protein
VAGRVDQRLLLAGRGPPEDEHDPLGLAVDGLDDGVGEPLPPLALMGRRLTGPYGEGGVEQQHPLPGPAVETAVVGPLHPDVVRQFGEDVLQRRRERHAGPDTETQAVGLVRSVIRVLPENQHLDVRVGRQVEGGEDLVVGRVDRRPAPFVGDEPLQRLEIIGVELPPQDRVPVGLDRHGPNVPRPRPGGAA